MSSLKPSRKYLIEVLSKSLHVFGDVDGDHSVIVEGVELRPQPEERRWSVHIDVDCWMASVNRIGRWDGEFISSEESLDGFIDDLVASKSC